MDTSAQDVEYEHQDGESTKRMQGKYQSGFHLEVWRWSMLRWKPVPSNSPEIYSEIQGIPHRGKDRDAMLDGSGGVSVVTINCTFSRLGNRQSGIRPLCKYPRRAAHCNEKHVQLDFGV